MASTSDRSSEPPIEPRPAPGEAVPTEAKPGTRAVGAPAAPVEQATHPNQPAAAPPTPPAAHPPSHSWRKWLLSAGIVVGLAVGGYFVWQWTRPADPPAGFAKTHGRIEATRVMTTTKLAGKIQEVLVREGDSVDAGQVVARMDTRSLKAQLRKAEAQLQKARDAKNTAVAVVAERESELRLAIENFERRKELLPSGGASKEDADATKSKTETTKAALQEARSQVIEAASTIEVATAEADRLRVDIEDCSLVAPVRGRIQYRLAEPLEVLEAGGRVLDLIDLTDVYMILYLPEEQAGRAAIGAEARIILDAAPEWVAPAKVYYVAAEAQFTPKTVETAEERQKLAFQVRVRIARDLVRQYEPMIMIGIPGVVYVRLDPNAEWPARLQVRLPPPEGKK